jgi:protein O-GlcNAc transferase
VIAAESPAVLHALQYAKGAFAAGQLSASEIVCRNILDEEPDCAGAHELLGFIAVKVGLLQQAKTHFDAALRNESPGRHILKRIRYGSRFLSIALKGLRKERSEDRFLVIKSWGAGFWADVSHVLGCMLLAEVTNRIPVIHWGKNCLYGDGTSQSAFQNYFEPASNISLDDLLQIPSATFFPPKWERNNLAEENIARRQGEGSCLGAVHFLNRPETIAVADFYIGVVYVAPWIPRHHAMHGKPLKELYFYLIGKYLHARPGILAECKAFFEQHLAGAPCIAVHLRGSDKIAEEKDLPETNATIRDAVASMPKHYRIFLLTDDEHDLADMKNAYGDRLIATDCQRTNTLRGTHFLPSVYPLKAGLEIVRDAYLALMADQFIGSGGSNVSAMIAMMKPWPPGTCALIGKSQLGQRQLSVYMPLAKDPRNMTNNVRGSVRALLRSLWDAVRAIVSG